MYGDEDNRVTCSDCLTAFSYSYCCSCIDKQKTTLEEYIEKLEKRVTDLENMFITRLEKVKDAV